MCEPFNKHMFRWQDRLVGGGRVSSTGGTSCSLMYWSTLTYSCLHKDRWVQGLEEGGYQVQEEWALPWCTRERQPTHVPLRTDGVFKGWGAWGLSPLWISEIYGFKRPAVAEPPPSKEKNVKPPLSTNSWQRPWVQGLGDNFIYAKILFFPNLSFVKGTESINSSDPPYKKVNVRFTTVPIKPLTVHRVQRSPCVNLYKTGRIAVNPVLPCVQCELNSTHHS